MSKYAVATIRHWNLSCYENRRPNMPGEWHLIRDPSDLNADAVSDLQPRYIFFPHWSWKVPSDVLQQSECVCFHMTDLPYGRGGSPLQNLIVRGHSETMMSAFRMTENMDDGPIYMKRHLSLGGRAQEIFERGAEIVFDMIEEIVANEPDPVPQTGEPTFFKRRTPDMSALPANADADALYDHIRMLDAQGYPPAFLQADGCRMEFTEPELSKDGIQARVNIKISEKAPDNE